MGTRSRMWDPRREGSGLWQPLQQGESLESSSSLERKLRRRKKNHLGEGEKLLEDNVTPEKHHCCSSKKVSSLLMAYLEDI